MTKYYIVVFSVIKNFLREKTAPTTINLNLKGTPGEFKEELADFDTEVIVMKPGEKRNF